MNQKILTILSNKYNLDEEIIERIIRSEFEFVKDTMEQGEYQAIRLHYFGVFGAKEGRIKQLKKKYGESI